MGSTPGIEWTFLRAGEFMTNMLDWADTIRTEGVVRGAYGAPAFAPIDLIDIAAVAAKTLLTHGHYGAKYVLTGPESLSKIDRVRIIGEAIGRDIRFVELTHDEARAEMITRGYGDAADWLLDGDALAIEHPQLPDPTVARLLGRPARTFAQWAAAN
ncbi:MAG: hydroxylase, partial [Thermomicrobiales bacterium]